MTDDSQDFAIVFADLSGSTQIYETLGDDRAHEVISACLLMLSDVVRRCRGTVIKTIGDEVMCTFENADAAVEASIEMHKSLDYPPPVVLELLERPVIRVGVHAGRVISKDGDIFGDAVNIAARMVSLAKPRQIITTGQTVEMLSGKAGYDVKLIERTTIKGKKEKVSLFEVIWEDDTLSVGLTRKRVRKDTLQRLHLRYHEKDLYVDQSKPVITIGRQPQNDVVIDNVITSRIHARIEYDRGEFVLIDQSTNGTYVCLDGKRPSYVHYDKIVLDGSGVIGPGRQDKEGLKETIHFSFERCIWPPLNKKHAGF